MIFVFIIIKCLRYHAICQLNAKLLLKMQAMNRGHGKIVT